MNTRLSRPSRAQSLARVSTLAAVATASSAHAAIITFNTSITSNSSTLGSTSWNIDGTGGDEANFVNGTSSSGNVFRKALRGYGGFKMVVVTAYAGLLGLASNVRISADNFFRTTRIAVFQNGYFRSASNFPSGESAYIGFQFKPDSTVLYGWADVTLTETEDDTYGTFTVNRWAYDDTGASILTGQTVAAPVPEPATYALGLGALALGAAGLRRRRQARAVAA